MVVEACDGDVHSTMAWCPDCNARRKHIFISQFAIECCECGEISEVPIEGLTLPANLRSQGKPGRL
jgi:hypothetical protein